MQTNDAALPQPDTNIATPVSSPFIPMPTISTHLPVPAKKTEKQKPLSPDQLEQQMDMRATTQMDMHE